MAKKAAKNKTHGRSQHISAYPVTPDPPIDPTTVVPELAERAKTTVRLHPRQGEAPVDASKVGGTFLWPKKEVWPTCSEHGDCPYVAGLQIRKEDVPELKFRPRTNLMQVLWCPNYHEPQYCPEVKVFWRDARRIRDRLKSHPTLTTYDDDNVPSPCVVYPERVVEYPLELPRRLREKIETSQVLEDLLDNLPVKPIENWGVPEDVSYLYQSWLSRAEGTKIGGYPPWVQDAYYPKCRSCRRRMEYLLSFDSYEFDGASWGRWLPKNERRVLKATYPVRNKVQCAANWMFGDAGNMYVFICYRCKDWPVYAFIQCS